jgi:hypothetical protein
MYLYINQGEDKTSYYERNDGKRKRKRVAGCDKKSGRRDEQEAKKVKECMESQTGPR